jgi:RimJ/RimL family protein N-acetyltransferase
MREGSTIETARLVLREPALEDAEPVYALWTDPVVVRYITGEPLERRRTWMNLLAYAGHWGVLGYGGWSVIEKSTGAFVGQVGLQRFSRGIDASREDLPEAGWVIASQAHGKGYGTEAMLAALAWADANIDAPKTVAIVNPDNDPSLRLAHKLGYHDVAIVTYLDHPVVLLERDRP